MNYVINKLSFLVMPYAFVEKQDTVVLNTFCVMEQLPHGELTAAKRQQQGPCKMTNALMTGWESMVS